MRDISLHMLDLAQNSIAAKASLVVITFDLGADGWLRFQIEDDGQGIAPGLIDKVQSPFTTTRTTRKVGLGIPMLTQNSRLSGGDVSIQSRKGKGTCLSATFNTAHIDCLPLGDVAGTLLSLIVMNPLTPDFCLMVRSPAGEGDFDTRPVRQAVSPLSLNEPEIVAWMREALNHEIMPLLGGAIL